MSHFARLSLSLVLAAIVAAQERPSSFTATTRLVEFTVVALDKQGAPVTNLSKEQFAVLDNGSPRPIAFFRYEGGSEQAQSAESTPLPPGTFANRLDMAAVPARNATALVLDGLNTSLDDQAIVKAQMLRFLQTLVPQTRVAIFQLGPGLKIVHDFTDDMSALRAALEKTTHGNAGLKPVEIQRLAAEMEEVLQQAEAAKRGAPRGMVEAVKKQIVEEANYNGFIKRSRLYATLGMLESLGNYMSGTPGRKSVVWVSAGISAQTMSAHSETDRMTVSPGPSYERAIKSAAQKLASQGVTLYAVDARGLVSTAENLSELQYMPSFGGRFQQVVDAMRWSDDPRAAFGMLTSITGGRVFFNTNDLTTPVKQAMSDMRGCYSLAFYLPDEPGGKWHTLKATVSVPRVEIRHRSGFSSGASPSDSSNTRKLLLDPLGATAIGVIATAAPVSDAQGAVDLRLRINADDVSFRTVDGRRRGEIAVVIADIGPKGAAAFHEQTIKLDFAPEQWAIARQKGIPFRRAYTPAAKTIAIRALVRDTALERAGVVDVPLSAVLPRR